jgi:hypothetical protein
MGNTYQNLPPLRETMDNTENYKQHDNRVAYINTGSLIDI